MKEIDLIEEPKPGSSKDVIIEYQLKLQKVLMKKCGELEDVMNRKYSLDNFIEKCQKNLF